METADPSEWAGDVDICVVCPDCSSELDVANEVLNDQKTEIDDHKSEINGLYHDLEELEACISEKEKEIKDLKDFIDGYIDDR